MDRWNLLELEAPEGTRSPVVLHSADAGRAVFIALDPGQELGDHQVKETAFVLVVDGVAQVEAGGRRIDPPSWTRVGKRGLIFAPLMFLTVSFLSKNVSVAQRIYQTAFLLAFFLPFSYLMDSLMYRSYLRRTGAAPPESGRRRWRG